MDPLMIVSPHLDDAVLSCGQLMAGRPDCVVVTVFATAPEVAQATPYDVSCGFTDSTWAMAARQDEDDDALRVLGARPVHMRFCDGQYGERDEGDLCNIAAALQEAWDLLGRPPVMGPVGLAHPDHELVAAAVRRAFGHLPECPELYAYEELPARVLWPELVRPALDLWEAETAHHYELGFMGTGSRETKAMALLAYRSQLPLVNALEDGGGQVAMFCPERYWRPT